MYTLLNYTNSTIKRTENVSESINFLYSSSSSSADKISSILLIFILSILCLFGVIFMIFGPMMRSEAWKRVDNYIFGQDMEHENQHDDGAETGGE
jgi:heme/copper-type cytochrome/quinol oxidase subunit 3